MAGLLETEHTPITLLHTVPGGGFCQSGQVICQVGQARHSTVMVLGTIGARNYRHNPVEPPQLVCSPLTIKIGTCLKGQDCSGGHQGMVDFESQLPCVVRHFILSSKWVGPENSVQCFVVASSV